jgi:hypothetical protein
VFKYAKNSLGEIIRNFAGKPFLFTLDEDIDGFLTQILGYSEEEYTVHLLILRNGIKAEEVNLIAC